MTDSQSIRQNYIPELLPNFRSLGVVLRIFLFANSLAILESFIHSTTLQEVLLRLINNAALLQPILFACLLLLYMLDRPLAQLHYTRGVIAVLMLTAATTIFITLLGEGLYFPASEHFNFNLSKYSFESVLVTYSLLVYFKWRSYMLSPAIYEARLQALQARIRPHFLFNCINTALSVVRSNPRLAESVLEDMSDLFRMAMSADREFILLAEEIELSRRYLELEKLRLGERMTAQWHIENLPDDALSPPLMLQPLLENAVYHGIEPIAEGGIIDIRVARRNDEVHIEIYNPLPASDRQKHGNKLALMNIRERLALLFDIEASYTVERGSDFYRVHIIMPYINKART